MAEKRRGRAEVAAINIPATWEGCKALILAQAATIREQEATIAAQTSASAEQALALASHQMKLDDDQRVGEAPKAAQSVRERPSQ